MLALYNTLSLLWLLFLQLTYWQFYTAWTSSCEFCWSFSSTNSLVRYSVDLSNPGQRQFYPTFGLPWSAHPGLLTWASYKCKIDVNNVPTCRNTNLHFFDFDFVSRRRRRSSIRTAWHNFTNSNTERQCWHSSTPPSVLIDLRFGKIESR